MKNDTNPAALTPIERASSMAIGKRNRWAELGFSGCASSLCVFGRQSGQCVNGPCNCLRHGETVGFGLMLERMVSIIGDSLQTAPAPMGPPEQLLEADLGWLRQRRAEHDGPAVAHIEQVLRTAAARSARDNRADGQVYGTAVLVGHVLGLGVGSVNGLELDVMTAEQLYLTQDLCAALATSQERHREVWLAYETAKRIIRTFSAKLPMPELDEPGAPCLPSGPFADEMAELRVAGELAGLKGGRDGHG